MYSLEYMYVHVHDATLNILTDTDVLCPAMLQHDTTLIAVKYASYFSLVLLFRPWPSHFSTYIYFFSI